jgi:uncharacterized repeat protein (TIGR01451 family)
VTVSYAVVVNSPLANGTSIVNTAWVTSSEVAVAERATITDTVSSAPVLAIQTSSADANGGTVAPGDRITYTVVVRNNGTANATGGVISDSVPVNTAFVAGSIALDPAGAGTKGTTPPTLASGLTITAGQSVTVSYAVVVNSPLANGTQIVNMASVSSSEVGVTSSLPVTNTVTANYDIYLPLIQKH